jgi:hypothetical protein
MKSEVKGTATSKRLGNIDVGNVVAMGDEKHCEEVILQPHQ